MTRNDAGTGSAALAGGRAGLLVCAAVLASGCVAGAHMRAEKPFIFTVAYEKKGERTCPAQVTMEEGDRNCGIFFPAKDCVKVQGGKPYRIRFHPSPADAPAFEVRFDPFRDEFKGKKGELEYTVDPKAPPKTYSFNIVAEGCEILDPRIVVEW